MEGFGWNRTWGEAASLHSDSRGYSLDKAVVPIGTGVRFAQALAWSWLIGLSAQWAVPLPFTPVPISGQSSAVLCSGALLGARWGAAAAAFYLLQGALGLPVFAPQGPMGAARFAGPTGGYLLGFLPGAWLVGVLAEDGWNRSALRTAFMMVFGSLVIFAGGVAGLLRFVSFERALELGVYPFILGDLFKTALATGIIPICSRFFQDPYERS